MVNYKVVYNVAKIVWRPDGSARTRWGAPTAVSTISLASLRGAGVAGLGLMRLLPALPFGAFLATYRPTISKWTAELTDILSW